MIALEVALEGQQATARRLRQISNRLERNMNKAMGQEAQLLRRMIVTGIRKQAPGGQKFLKLSEATKKRKKSTKALIHRGDLIRSINVVRVSGGQAWFVGVHKMAVDSKGKPLANIAEVHEFGTKPGAKRKVPARPYLRPSFAVWQRDVQGRVTTRMVHLLGLGKAMAFGHAVSKLLPSNSGQAALASNKISAVYKAGGKLDWKID